MPEERVTTGSEPRRWTIYVCPKCPDYPGALLPGSCGKHEWLVPVEVVEPGHDERATRLREWATGQRDLWRHQQCHAASELSANYAEGYADAMAEVLRFNLSSEGTDG